jgi:hypothetical protein
MAPWDVTTWGHWADVLVHLALGFGFGFVLERAGFGNSKKLAAQFYFSDLTVLKVMFTAIVTAMVLLFWSVGLGLVDFEKIWVNPTYLWPGILGGLVFGVGFLVGGYCPGTSLVAAATLKLDGVAFALGLLAGIFAFGQTVPLFERFWSDSGFLGRLTLFQWLGVPPPVVVVGAVFMALGMFAGGEALERWVSSRADPLRSGAEAP